ncbi:hypothetical protein HDV03_002752 [Kappamyces sp. JEL0829]|nr:hypothetical protein HDV03_002752 [Kappamyces sp. JEL0829]
MADFTSNTLQGVRRKNQKRGLTFTLMVAGSSGSGKTTFINTLCESQVIPPRTIPDAETAALDKTVQITPTTIDLDEDGTKLTLTIIDTPGFGDNINNEGSFQDIVKYIEAQYDEILAQESRIKRNPKFQDNRVHAVLYFVQPTGHALRETDIEFMKRLSHRANVIPVIAKSDSFTKTELQDFKHRVMADIVHFDIPVYDFPVDPEEDDEDTIEESQAYRKMMPFSVIGNEKEVKVGGRTVRGRTYPWGMVEVDNPQHCDFAKLRYILLNSHLQDLKEITHDVLYENFRTERLSQEAGNVANDSVLVSQ